MKRFASLLLAAALAVCAALPASAAEKILRICYVKSPFNLQHIVMKERGILEKHMEKLGVAVKWYDINSGATQAQAMASGDLDVSGVMNSTSALIANGEGNPVKVIAGVSRPLEVFGIVARKGGVQSIADLKGKTVAGPKGTVLHQILVAALKANGLSAKDVKFVQMGIPKGVAAMKNGSVDAALVAANFLINCVNEGDTVLATAKGYAVPKLMMTASERFITEHPDRLAAVLAAHEEATVWMEQNHDEAIAIGAKEQGISIADAEKLFAWTEFVRTFGEDDMKSMEDDMAFLLENGMMRKTVDVRSLFLPSAVKK
jgi:NitT/TauT family transport system substrate-binding protein/sulfonate transport system substrate-binding protein